MPSPNYEEENLDEINFNERSNFEEDEDFYRIDLPDHLIYSNQSPRPNGIESDQKSVNEYGLLPSIRTNDPKK